MKKILEILWEKEREFEKLEKVGNFNQRTRR